MKKPFAEALQDLIDAYLEEHASTSLARDVMVYAMEQQCRLLRATNSKPTVEQVRTDLDHAFDEGEEA